MDENNGKLFIHCKTKNLSEFIVFAVFRPQYHFCLFSLTIFPSCYVKQRGNQIAIDSIGRKKGVIVIDYDYLKLIHTILIVIVIE